MPPTQIEAPYYPIVYVRGYAMRAAEREENFHDTYYGFSATSVEKRKAPPPRYVEADVFEGQLIRFMKLRDYAYADAANRGESLHSHPARSLWVCRFYDQDYFNDSRREIEDHAEELRKLVCEEIPQRLQEAGVDLGGPSLSKYKVILIAHSMGGLVCRTLIQNRMVPMRGLGDQRAGSDPKRWIHRLVTLGSPHGGIDLGRIPDFIERPIVSKLNPSGANIFQEERIRQYLALADSDDVRSIGHEFPVKRCLCIIGSDHKSYSAVRELTGNFSDGLVKQDRAYLVGGPPPAPGQKYPQAQTCFYANVHRAHSGHQGIVNSYESFENIHRFLFGDIRADISLEKIEIPAPPDAAPDDSVFYDFEFMLSIRNSGAYIHRREQDPCENAIRVRRADLQKQLFLHTVFMNSKLKPPAKNPPSEDDQYSHFACKLRVLEHRVKKGLLWDREYPEKPIYNESIELRVGNAVATQNRVQYRWLSDAARVWQDVQPDTDGALRIQLRGQGALRGALCLHPSVWPDAQLTADS